MISCNSITPVTLLFLLLRGSTSIGSYSVYLFFLLQGEIHIRPLGHFTNRIISPLSDLYSTLEIQSTGPGFCSEWNHFSPIHIDRAAGQWLRASSTIDLPSGVSSAMKRAYRTFQTNFHQFLFLKDRNWLLSCCLW